MSYLELSTPSLPFKKKKKKRKKKRKGQGARQRYASLSCLLALRVNLAHAQQFIYYIDPHP
jgi:hypothetical protein